MARLKRMVEAGALDEVERLARSPAIFRPSAPAMKALGVAPFAAHLRGETRPRRDALTLIAQRDTRRYAKRQATWFRHQAADWERLLVRTASRRLLR